MNRYLLLVLFLLVIVLSTLHFFGTKNDKNKDKAEMKKNEEPAATVYERYELYRSKDRIFHHSYPVSWFMVDTTSENATKEADIFQTWSLSDQPVAWQVKADFKLTQIEDNSRNLSDTICARHDKECEEETINGIGYSKMTKVAYDGTQELSYESVLGSKIITIDVTVKPTSQEKIQQWNMIVKSFRFFE